MYKNNIQDIENIVSCIYQSMIRFLEKTIFDPSPVICELPIEAMEYPFGHSIR